MWIESEFRSSQGYVFRVSHKVSQLTSERGTVVFLHGWGDHSGRYRPLADRLSQLGFTVVLPDFIGHGRSEGPRARVNVFNVLIEDLKLLLEQKPFSTPVILHGHSMGGCLAFHYALAYPDQVERLIFNSAALGVSQQIPAWKKLMAKWLGLLLPNIPLLALKNSQLMTSVQTEQRRYMEDGQIYHGRIEPATGWALLQANRFCENNLGQLRHPFLLLQGCDDKLVCLQAGRKLYSLRQDPRSMFAEFNARHDLLHDDCAAQVMEKIERWLLG